MSKKSGTYYYGFADSEARIELKAGENGVTQAHIDLLIKWEKDEHEKRRYREEEKEVPYDEVLENVVGTYDDVEAEEKDPKQERMEELLRSCVERLRPEQQQLYYEYYGMKKTTVELGAERGIKKQSVSGQLETIKRNLRKMLEEYE